jgi:hypothetical protein
MLDNFLFLGVKAHLHNAQICTKLMCFKEQNHMYFILKIHKRLVYTMAIIALS